MKTIFSEMEKLLFVPPRLCNFEIIYRALIGSEKMHWDFFVENGLSELQSLQKLKLRDFQFSDQFIECLISKVGERSVNEKWEIAMAKSKDGETPFRVFECQFRLNNNWVKAAIDIMDRGFQFRFHGYLPLSFPVN
jgi:hypothetical protein